MASYVVRHAFTHTRSIPSWLEGAGTFASTRISMRVFGVSFTLRVSSCVAFISILFISYGFVEYMNILLIFTDSYLLLIRILVYRSTLQRFDVCAPNRDALHCCCRTAVFCYARNQHERHEWLRHEWRYCLPLSSAFRERETPIIAWTPNAFGSEPLTMTMTTIA